MPAHQQVSPHLLSLVLELFLVLPFFPVHFQFLKIPSLQQPILLCKLFLIQKLGLLSSYIYQLLIVSPLTYQCKAFLQTDLFKKLSDPNFPAS